MERTGRPSMVSGIRTSWACLSQPVIITPSPAISQLSCRHSPDCATHHRETQAPNRKSALFAIPLSKLLPVSKRNQFFRKALSSNSILFRAMAMFFDFL